jgi:hypothetical protein
MVDSAFNRNEYQESSGGKGRPERKADNLAAICEPIVYRLRNNVCLFLNAWERAYLFVSWKRRNLSQ